MSRQIILIIILTIGFPSISGAQEKPFSLQDCIIYALVNSTDIGRAKNSVEIENAYLEQSKAARLPNLQLGASQQLSSAGSYNTTNNEWSRNSNATLSVSLNSQVSLYNGAKIKNTISQSQINLEAAELNIQTEQELIGLNILSAYINVLLAKDNVQNSQLQLEAIQKQLTYAEARKEAGSISLSDLLIIKSQQASDKTSLIESESNLRIALVSLMQLMNMPVSNKFDIQQPDIDKLIGDTIETNPAMVYEIALGIQPNIKTAKLNVESAETGISIAKADAMPKLTLNGAMNTGYGSNINGVDFGEQFSNSVNPYVGLSLSVPIFQQKQTKTQVKLAQIQVSNSELELIDIENDLRKYIEQACTDAQTAQSNYQALQEQLDAENESYQVADEMYNQGMINSVDFLLSKNNLIVAKNKFTQAKYNLILQNKIVEYYLVNTISL
jgi:outer membrane protein